MSTLHADPVALLASLTADERREALHLYPAWAALCGYVLPSAHPRETPAAVVGILIETDWDIDRAVSYLHAHGHADDLVEAAGVLDELLGMAREGRRPRYAIEIGAGRS